MKATCSLLTYARRADQSQLSKQLYTSSNHPRSTLQNALQPLLLRERQFFSTTRKSQDPPRTYPNTSDFMRDLIRDTRAPEPKQKETLSAKFDQILSTARMQRHTTGLRSPAAPTTQADMLKNLQSTLMDVYDNELSRPPSSVSLRLKPTLGRTVDGLYGDPTRGFRQIDRKLADNNVKGDVRSQEKHVRRGQRKKNIRILRWRKLFMEGFKSELDTIQRMRRQGW